MLNKKALAASVSAPPAIYPEDVFSTYLYTGTGATQSINNGIDLSGKGGLVWCKTRNVTNLHSLVDTARGASKWLGSSNTSAEQTYTDAITSFNNNGFTLGADTQGGYVNPSGYPNVSWTFRKQPKFFDVVTATKSGGIVTFNHNLGVAPGMVFVKSLNGAENWLVYHRSLGVNQYTFLNRTDAAGTYGGVFSSSSTQFSLNSADQTDYVAYLFAHNAGGFGTAGTDNVISCGSFTASGSGGGEINLGYEPQFVMIKRSDSTGSWEMFDTMRGYTVGDDVKLLANTSGAEQSGFNGGEPFANGFREFHAAGTYIYMAIRRPMKVPTTGTSVFTPAIRTGTGANATITSTTAPVDFTWIRQRDNTSGYSFMFFDRLRGALKLLYTNNNQSQNNTSETVTGFDVQNGYKLGDDASGYGTNVSGKNIVYYNFRRAPGFFDEVCYTGPGGVVTQAHNLGVVPELMIVKKRDSTIANGDWVVWNTTFTTNQIIVLNTSDAVTGSNGFNSTPPTASVFTLGDNLYTNYGNSAYVAYLFATLAGVSKVGSYTGTAAAQTINCGFTAGARFVLIKRKDSTGDWYVWDTARGIISGNDPYLLLNSTAAEVTSTDYIDPVSSGFEISSTAPAAINASGGSFIFMAIA